MAVLLTSIHYSLIPRTYPVPAFSGLEFIFLALGSRGAHPSPVVSLVLSWENGFVPFEAVQGQNLTGGAARRTTLPIV